MSYATLNDLVQAFGEVEVNQLLESVNDERLLPLTQEWSAGLIDSYLSERYLVPLVNRIPVVIGVDCDLIRWRLYDDRIPESVQLRYEAAIDWLRNVARGLLSLPASLIGSDNSVAYSRPPSVFTRYV